MNPRALLGAGLASAVSIALAAACHSTPLHDQDNDAYAREKAAREKEQNRAHAIADGDAALPVIDLAEAERVRAAYRALPPTAAPIGSTLWGKTCPDDYGPVVEKDAGSYCGKICGAYSPCDDDAGSQTCCHTHACNRKLSSSVPWRSFYDGPPPSACAP